MLSSSRPRARASAARRAHEPHCSTPAAARPAKPPYWVLELQVEHLSQRVAELEEALEAATAPQPPILGGDRLKEIRSVVCGRLGVSPAALDSPARDARVAWARQVAMYLARELTDAPLPTIGAAFDRNHTTVLHACRRVRQRLATDLGAQELVRELTEALQEAEPTPSRSASEPAARGRARAAWTLRLVTAVLPRRGARRRLLHGA